MSEPRSEGQRRVGRNESADSGVPATPVLTLVRARRQVSPVPASAHSESLTELLAGLVLGGEATAAVALSGRPGAGEVTGATAGWWNFDNRSPVRARDLFDWASLTKPWMATLALRLDGAGRLPLDLPIGEAWPEAAPKLARRTLEDLLRHRAGFFPWTPLYRRARSPAGVERLLLADELLGARAGTYSDLGYILWGLTAERVLDTELRTLLWRWVCGPLGLSSGRAATGASQVVECELDNSREVELAADQGIRVARRPGRGLGRPQDGNARFLAGLAGHAGLFGSAEALWALAGEWLAPGALLTPEQVAAALAGGGPYGLGWARRRRSGGSGPALGRDAFGHSGFTGGSLWIDPGPGGIHILLAHRTSPAVPMDRLRRRFHRLGASL